jgi:hypothetical protein
LLKKIGSLTALAATLLLGIAAGLFIAGCGSKAKPEPEPGKPPTDQPPAPPQKPEPKPEDKGQADKKQVDRKEVEEGQPLPRNYLE